MGWDDMRWFGLDDSALCLRAHRQRPKRPPAGLRQLFELTNKGARKILLQASSPPKRRLPNRSDLIGAAAGRAANPARRTGQLRPLARAKTSQQNEHTRIADSKWAEAV